MEKVVFDLMTDLGDENIRNTPDPNNTIDHSNNFVNMCAVDALIIVDHLRFNIFSQLLHWTEMWTL